MKNHKLDRICQEDEEVLKTNNEEYLYRELIHFLEEREKRKQKKFQG